MGGMGEVSKSIFDGGGGCSMVWEKTGLVKKVKKNSSSKTEVLRHMPGSLIEHILRF